MLPKINATTKINASNEFFLKVLLKNIRLRSAVININKQIHRANKEIKNNPSKNVSVINDNTNSKLLILNYSQNLPNKSKNFSNLFD
ncbi:MAG: hypothetical protein WCO37_12595, partial [Bacteroidota bacterium]